MFTLHHKTNILLHFYPHLTTPTISFQFTLVTYIHMTYYNISSLDITIPSFPFLWKFFSSFFTVDRYIWSHIIYCGCGYYYNKIIIIIIMSTVTTYYQNLSCRLDACIDFFFFFFIYLFFFLFF